MARTKAFDEQTVLEKATDLFWQKGYHNTSMDDLVKHLGINRSSIYTTFGNKDALFTKALNHYLKDSQSKVRPSIEDYPDLEAFLRDFLSFIVKDSLEYNEGKGCFAVNCTTELAAHNEEIRQILQDNMDHFVEEMTPVFAQKIQEGELSRKKNPRALAQFLFSIMSSIKLLSRKTKDLDLMQNITQTAISAILK